MATKPSPIEAFHANMADAHHLVAIAKALTNHSQRRMRSEVREKLGSALGIKRVDRELLDWSRSPDATVIILPGSKLVRDDFKDQRALLRQAIVAGCAATETYLADKVVSRVSTSMPSIAEVAPKLKSVPLTVGEWLAIEESYQRRKFGLRSRVIEPYVRQRASTSPTKFGEMLGLIEFANWAERLDKHRGVPKGQTVDFLDRVTNRRNVIAHQGDRQGYNRAKLSVKEVQDDLAGLESIINSLEAMLGDKPPSKRVASKKLARKSPTKPSKAHRGS